MASLTKRIDDIDLKIKKIPCFNEKGCGLHREIMDSLRVIEAMLRGNQIELHDLRQGFMIVMEDHGIKCDKISGWDLSKYREMTQKNVRKRRIFGSRNKNKDVNDRIGSKIKSKIEEGKKRRFTRKRKREREKNGRN